MRILNSHYIAGFVDGEGCFALNYRADRRYDSNGNKIYEYHYWTTEFAIVLHPSDANLLHLIKDSLGVGHISFKRAGDQVRYSVQNTTELNNIVVPFFEKNSLFGTKAKDFELWSQAIKLLHIHRQKKRTGRSRPLDRSVEQKLRELKSQMDHIKRKGRVRGLNV